jgi:hypothetical protein
MIIMMILHQAGPPIIIHSAVIKHGAQDELHYAHHKLSLQTVMRTLKDCNDTAGSPLMFRRSNELIRCKSKLCTPKTLLKVS